MSRFDEQLDRYLTDPEYGERRPAEGLDPDEARDRQREREREDEEQ